jgi:hypothetical protein
MVKAATKQTKTKKTVVKTAPPASSQPEQPTYRSFRLGKPIKGEKLPGAFRLLQEALGVIGRNSKVFLGIVLIYGALTALLVQGFSAAGSLDEAKETLDQLFTGNWGQLAGGLTLFVYLLGASGNTASPAAGAYQLMLGLVVGLAFIWLLRQLYAGHKVRVRDAFYRGMAPLVQFVLVLGVVIVQLLPLAIGLMLYSTVTANGLAATAVEGLLWALLALVLSSVSLYMISSSLFALYIVTLPNMTPLAALRSARQLVVNRRWAVLRKLLFLPFILLVIAALIVVPIILFATPLAAWVFFALTMLLLPIVHSYMYALYRSLM